MTRRTWLQLAAAGPALGQSVFSIRPKLNPRLTALWNQALGTMETATVVSSVVHAALPALRGWRDERFLHSYMGWANRPESAGFDGETITADLGPFDWILFRRPVDRLVSTPPAESDPIGYALFQPGAGVHRIKVTGAVVDMARPLPLNRLSNSPLPEIDAIVPVGKGIVTLYGSGFEGDKFEIASEAGPGEILFAAHNQVNARVPSLDRVRLTIDGSATPWVAVTKVTAKKR